MTHDERDRGFSLVELLVVIGILGVLAGMAMPALASHRTRARAATVKLSLRDATHAQEMRAGDGLPYAPVGAAGVAALEAEGFNLTDGVTIEVLASAPGYCLRGTAAGVDAHYVTNAGPLAGRVTTVPCAS